MLASRFPSERGAHVIFRTLRFAMLSPLVPHSNVLPLNVPPLNVAQKIAGANSKK
jgi:hypothetical protein